MPRTASGLSMSGRPNREVQLAGRGRWLGGGAVPGLARASGCVPGVSRRHSRRGGDRRPDGSGSRANCSSVAWCAAPTALRIEAFRRVERHPGRRTRRLVGRCELAGRPRRLRRLGPRADPRQRQPQRHPAVGIAGGRRPIGLGGCRRPAAGRHPERRHLGRVGVGVGLLSCEDATLPTPASRDDPQRCCTVAGPQPGGHAVASDAVIRRSCRGCPRSTRCSTWRLGGAALGCDDDRAPLVRPCLLGALDVHRRSTPRGARGGGCCPLPRVGAWRDHHLQGARAPGAGHAPRSTAGRGDSGRDRVGVDRFFVVPVPVHTCSHSSQGTRPRTSTGSPGSRCAPESSAKSVLSWGRPVSDQSALSVIDRRTNVAGAMVAPGPRGGRAHVVLVDDVMTTGATLDEGLRALTAMLATTSSPACVVAAVDARRALAPQTASDSVKGSNGGALHLRHSG